MSMNNVEISPLDAQNPPSLPANSQHIETPDRTATHVHMRGLSAFGVEDVYLFRPENFQEVCQPSFSLYLNNSLSPGNPL